MGAFDVDGMIGPVFEGRARRKAAVARADALGRLDFGVDELIASTADPTEAAAYNDQLSSFKAMVTSLDPELQARGLEGLQQMGNEVRSALKERRTQQVGFISDALKDQRDNYSKAMARQREVQANAEQMDALLSQEDFDPNAPQNRNTLIQLLNSNPRAFNSDPEDFADALGRVGGGGLLGGVVGLLSGALAAEDFVISKEDWRKLGEANYIYNSKPFLAEAEHIASSVSGLEQSAQQLNMFPPGYSPHAYVMEQEQAFENPFGPRGSYPEVAPKIPSAASVVSDAKGLLNFATGNTPDKQPPQPPKQVESNTPGSLLDNYFRPHRERGARIMVNPESGAATAQYGDGRTEDIELPFYARWLARRKVNR